MKLDLKTSLLTFLLFCFSIESNAGNGIKRSEWDFRPEITVGNFVYWLPLMFGQNYLAWKMIEKDPGETAESLPWWFPAVGLRSTMISDLIVGRTYYKVKENFFNWTNPDYSIGFGVNYTSKQVPFGLRIKLAFDHQGFRARERKENDWIDFTKDVIEPEAALKILFGKYRTAGTMVVASVGARYEYVLNAKGLHDGKETVNNGISGIFGLEYASPAQHISAGGYFVIPFYDYFNQSYTPDGGITYPYKDINTKGLTIMEVYIRYGF